MLYLLAYSGQGQLRIFGPSNEKYHVRGGNEQITDRMADVLGGDIELGTRLVALAQKSDGTWTVTTRTGKVTSSRDADHVVLALPFSLLRSVDLSKAGFPALKTTAIKHLVMGTNSKLQLQFTDRHWRILGGNGDTFSDRGYQSSWEVTRAQPGAKGILVDYTGGTIGASFTGSPKPTPSRSSARSSRSSQASPGSGTARSCWTSGRPTPGPSGRTPTGRSGSTPRSVASRASRSAPATLPGSTRRRTSRATSTAPSRPATAQPGRSWPH